MKKSSAARRASLATAFAGTAAVAGVGDLILVNPVAFIADDSWSLIAQVINIFAKVAGELVDLVLDNACLGGVILLADTRDTVRIVAISGSLGSVAYDRSIALLCLLGPAAAVTATTASSAATAIAASSVPAAVAISTATAPRGVVASATTAVAGATAATVTGRPRRGITVAVAAVTSSAAPLSLAVSLSESFRGDLGLHGLLRLHVSERGGMSECNAANRVK